MRYTAAVAWTLGWLLASAVMLGSGADAAAGDAPASTAAAEQPLPGVTVTGKPDALGKSDRHLGQLKKSLPTLGTDKAPHKTAADRVRDYAAAHSDPNKATGLQRKMMERAQRPPAPATPGEPPAGQ